MDDETYRIKNLNKIQLYQEEGIYTGKNLILTFETEDMPFNIRAIKKMLEDIFIK